MAVTYKIFHAETPYSSNKNNQRNNNWWKKWEKPANLYKYQNTAAPYPLAPSLKNVCLPNPTDHLPEEFPTTHLEDNEEDSFNKTN